MKKCGGSDVNKLYHLSELSDDKLDELESVMNSIIVFEQTKVLHIRTSASNKRFKSNSIYILSSTLNQTRCIQFINTLKLIITTASDIN